MKLAIIGATGFVGRQLVTEALSRGHHVTAIARHEKDLPKEDNLTLALGDIADEQWLQQQLAPQEVIISAFNPGWAEDNLYEKFIRGSKHILHAVEAANKKRLLVVGGAGSLEVAPGVELVDTPQFPDAIRAGAKGARDLRNILRDESNLEWTFISPPAMLEPGKRTGHFRFGTTQLLMDGDAPAKISVEDLAVAIINEAEKPEHIRQQFTVAN